MAYKRQPITTNRVWHNKFLLEFRDPRIEGWSSLEGNCDGIHGIAHNESINVSKIEGLMSNIKLFEIKDLVPIIDNKKFIDRVSVSEEGISLKILTNRNEYRIFDVAISKSQKNNTALLIKLIDSIETYILNKSVPKSRVCLSLIPCSMTCYFYSNLLIGSRTFIQNEIITIYNLHNKEVLETPDNKEALAELKKKAAVLTDFYSALKEALKDCDSE